MIYKFTLKPRGRMGTPLRSDTLFGHACWALRFNEGVKALESVLAETRQRRPPLVFSDGFPAGYLPRPLGWCATPRPDEDLGTVRRRKKLSRLRWISAPVVGELGWKKALAADPVNIDSIAAEPILTVRIHNIIDRLSETSLEKNGLYQSGELWYSGIWETVDIYVVSNWECDRLTGFLTRMFSTGYGRDTSTGMGQVELVKEPQVAQFVQATESSYFMSLSTMVPDESIDLKRSYYILEAKYGKVWQGLETDNPWKKPILRTCAGSVFHTSSPGPLHGCVVTGVHSDEKVVENCMAIPYPVPAEVCNG